MTRTIWEESTEQERKDPCSDGADIFMRSVDKKQTSEQRSSNMCCDACREGDGLDTGGESTSG